jgi:hypothetical protein
MYRLEINVSGHRAEVGEDIRSIRVSGTVGNKSGIVRELAKFPTLSAFSSMPPGGAA